MRVKRGVTARKRHKKVLKLVRGYSKSRTSSYRKANEAATRALAFAYRDRRTKKRDMRSLWITRISAAAKQNGTNYSRLMHALGENKINLNRQILAELAVNHPKAFASLVTSSQNNKSK